MIFNSLLEFNTGIPYLFMMWIFVNLKEYRVTKELVIETADEDLQIETDSSQQKQKKSKIENEWQLFFTHFSGFFLEIYS